MELWIRSQDKETLLPIDKPLMYWESIDNIHTHSIIFKESPSYIITLGTYKTKERASEVLDEIQNKIWQNQCLISLIHNVTNLKGNEEEVDKLFKDIIYEMPEE